MRFGGIKTANGVVKTGNSNIGFLPAVQTYRTDQI